MPMHDWTRVIAGIFHHFHHQWISTVAGSLNDGVLPNTYDALVEQTADAPIPDDLTNPRLTLEAEERIYAAKANRVAVYHATGDKVVGYIEIVSPGNKQSEAAIRKFLDKLAEAISENCHLLVIDPHPPTRRDPRGIHARFWEDYFGQRESPGVSDETPLSLAAYRSDLVPTAYFEPIAVGQALPPMPIFLTPDYYVNVPLEETYDAAWRSVPARWREVIAPSG
jgi:hypothetical protein